MRKLVLFGAGGHTRACIDVIRAEGRFEIVGLLEKNEDLIGARVLDLPVIGTDKDLEPLLDKNFDFFITLGQIKSPDTRIYLFQTLKTLGVILPTIIAPTAYVSPNAKLGEGTIVMHMAVIGPRSEIGCNCIVNNRSLIEHDVVVGDHCHISTGVLINGGCKIECGSFVGSGSVLQEGVLISERSTISMATRVYRKKVSN